MRSILAVLVMVTPLVAMPDSADLWTKPCADKYKPVLTKCVAIATSRRVDVNVQCYRPFEAKVRKCAGKVCLRDRADVVRIAAATMRELGEDRTLPAPRRELVGAVILDDPTFRAGGSYRSYDRLAKKVSVIIVEKTKKELVDYCELDPSPASIRRSCEVNPWSNLVQYTETACWQALIGRRDVSDTEQEQFCNLVEDRVKRGVNLLCAEVAKKYHFAYDPMELRSPATEGDD